MGTNRTIASTSRIFGITEPGDGTFLVQCEGYQVVLSPENCELEVERHSDGTLKSLHATHQASFGLDSSPVFCRPDTELTPVQKGSV